MVMTSLISATANLKVLNALREERGFNTLPLKPHAGEAGSRHHMATAFLLADSVNHGIKLQENPALEYLFYLAQIGLAVCPVSNRAPRFPE
jgi:AMP deaminase